MTRISGSGGQVSSEGRPLRSCVGEMRNSRSCCCLPRCFPFSLLRCCPNYSPCVFPCFASLITLFSVLSVASLFVFLEANSNLQANLTRYAHAHASWLGRWGRSRTENSDSKCRLEGQCRIEVNAADPPDPPSGASRRPSLTPRPPPLAHRRPAQRPSHRPVRPVPDSPPRRRRPAGRPISLHFWS